MKTHFLCLSLCLTLAACGSGPDKVAPIKNDDIVQNNFDETRVPANPVTDVAFASWKAADAKSALEVPTDAAIFKRIYFQSETVTPSPDQVQQALRQMSNEGRLVLKDMKLKCFLTSPVKDVAKVDASTSSINSRMVASGSACQIGIEKIHSTNLAILKKDSKTETFKTATTITSKVQVANTELQARAGVVSRTSTISVNGVYLRYLQSAYAFASGKVVVSGTFSVQLSDGQTIAGKVAGDSRFGGSPTEAQFLVEATSAQGDLYYVVKKKDGKTRYFLNGKKVAAGVAPDFLNFTNDYLL